MKPFPMMMLPKDPAERFAVVMRLLCPTETVVCAHCGRSTTSVGAPFISREQAIAMLEVDEP